MSTREHKGGVAVECWSLNKSGDRQVYPDVDTLDSCPSNQGLQSWDPWHLELQVAPPGYVPAQPTSSLSNQAHWELSLTWTVCGPMHHICPYSGQGNNCVARLSLPHISGEEKWNFFTVAYVKLVVLSPGMSVQLWHLTDNEKEKRKRREMLPWTKSILQSERDPRNHFIWILDEA